MAKTNMFLNFVFRFSTTKKNAKVEYAFGHFLFYYLLPSIKTKQQKK